MRAIFISYRRDDSEGQAGRLSKDLAGHFGQDAVFMDVAGIAPGRDFRRVIDEHVATCGVLLAVIGKTWITAQDASGRRRLDDPADFVRLETASALKRDIPVIPVLVHGAGMPQAEQLPPDLADLAYRNGVELSHARWDSDVQLLIKALEPYVQARRSDPGRDAGSAASGPVALSSSAASLSTASLPAAAPPATTGGGSAATQQRTKRPYLMIAGALAAVAVALAAYLSSGAWHAAPPRITEMAPKPGATPGPDRNEVAKAAEDAQMAAQAAASVAAEDAGLAAAKRDRDALAAKEADRLAAKKAADKAELDRLAALKRDREALAAKEAAAGQETERLAGKKAADKSEAERLTANRAAERVASERVASERVASERLASEKAAAERVAAERAEKAVADKAAGEAVAEKLPQEGRTARQLAMGRVRWISHDFPPPNGGATVFAIMPDGNPACASYNAASCLWGVSYEQLDFARLRPLVCGELHRARWGVTGYEDPKHWCNLARNVGSAGARVR